MIIKTYNNIENEFFSGKRIVKNPGLKRPFLGVETKKLKNPGNEQKRIHKAKNKISCFIRGRMEIGKGCAP